ncbi:hypothetical protein GCM10009730_05050 [Streptomyces albidochromogenes]
MLVTCRMRTRRASGLMVPIPAPDERRVIGRRTQFFRPCVLRLRPPWMSTAGVAAGDRATVRVGVRFVQAELPPVTAASAGPAVLPSVSGGQRRSGRGCAFSYRECP